MWAIDFQFDQTVDGRQLKFTNIVDEFTREAHVMNVARSCTAENVISILETLIGVHGAPQHLRMDNGPEFTARCLREWCHSSGVRTVYIEPGAPWENPFIESFHSRVRDEHLNIELFSTLSEAQIITEHWRTEYNTYRPTAPSMTAPQPDSTRTGPTNKPNSHNPWTYKWDPVTRIVGRWAVWVNCS